MTPDLQSFDEHVGKFFLSHTKEELYEGLSRKGCSSILCTIARHWQKPQLRARDAWTVEHLSWADDELPRRMGQDVRSQCQIRRAPLIGSIT
jgi:hypothetical protein